MEHLEACLLDWRDESIFHDQSSGQFFDSLQSLADELMQCAAACAPRRELLEHWPTASLFALDLRANPQRAGFCQDVWDNFPLQPGLRGVEWSAELGYRINESPSESSCTDDDEYHKFVERQRRLDRNVETACTLMRSALLESRESPTRRPNREEIENAWRYIDSVLR